MTGPDQAIGDLLAHVERTTVLDAAQGARLVADVLAFFDETPEDMVRRRHRELQREGLRNEEIFERIAVEVEAWRFRAPPISARRLRRMVYG